jgi:hypothetical protein
MDEIVQPFFVKFGFSNGEVRLFFTRMADAWRLLARSSARSDRDVAVWERFMKVVAPVAVIMHARCPHVRSLSAMI